MDMKRIIGLIVCLAMLCLTACTVTVTDSSDVSTAPASSTSERSEESVASEDSEASVPESEEESDELPGAKGPETPVTAPTDPPPPAPATQATTPPTTQVPDSRITNEAGHEIVTTNGVTYVDGVLVVNKTYSLPSSYNPGDLTAECDAAYMEMKAAAAEEGLRLYISSGFRSYDTQDVIYHRYVANDGQANADRYSARPGHSEHQTGLAIDLNGVSDSFGETAEGKWVAAHAHEYGFILRYPKGKEPQTGYMYEPWHIRYVGVEVATKIFVSDLCLEEYYGITSEYAN